jgi:hypothetical protein
MCEGSLPISDATQIPGRRRASVLVTVFRIDVVAGRAIRHPAVGDEVRHVGQSRDDAGVRGDGVHLEPHVFAVSALHSGDGAANCLRRPQRRHHGMDADRTVDRVEHQPARVVGVRTLELGAGQAEELASRRGRLHHVAGLVVDDDRSGKVSKPPAVRHRAKLCGGV